MEAGLTHCYFCGCDSFENEFKYFDNKKIDQPRYKCSGCGKHFTVGCRGRPQGKSYIKKRNIDPAELEALHRECPFCGLANNARFKYYNNKNFLQPRFKCLSCGKQFQMRLVSSGDKKRLVHVNNCRKPLASGWSNQQPEFSDASSCGNNASGSGQRASKPRNDLSVQESAVPELPVLEIWEEATELGVEETRCFDGIDACNIVSRSRNDLSLRGSAVPELPVLEIGEDATELGVEETRCFDGIHACNNVSRSGNDLSRRGSAVPPMPVLGLGEDATPLGVEELRQTDGIDVDNSVSRCGNDLRVQDCAISQVLFPGIGEDATALGIEEPQYSDVIAAELNLRRDVVRMKEAISKMRRDDLENFVVKKLFDKSLQPIVDPSEDVARR